MADNKDLAVQLLALRMDVALDHGIDTNCRTIQIVGQIDEEMFKRVDAGLTMLEDGSRKSITLRINSEGGTPEDALAIVGRMRGSTCKIITEAYGDCSSAATMVFVAGHKRRMSEFCRFMTHQSSYELVGTHAQISSYVVQAEKEEKIWASLLGRFTKFPAEHWYELHKAGKDIFIVPDDCLKYGITDEVF
jgi:ATP-dependent Clp protease protease subunit